MSKIVVLNSGGFDSIVLVNVVHCSFPDSEIHSLHFNYGENNLEQQNKCVDKVCNKLGIVNKKIELPKFDWTTSEFYDKGSYNYDKQYLEYRNLIFLSYAISYAESIGAEKIYLATLKSGDYSDTSELFFKGLNSFTTKLSGIEIVTPFSEFEDKSEELQYAIPLGIMPEDYFSCDKPNGDERCGECYDCKALDYIDSVLKVDNPFKALYQSNFNYEDSEFKRLLATDIPKNREVRALINNDCQLRCEHCFYGFDNMVSDKLPKEKYYEVLKELVLKHGFTNIHFSGKEPLYDDSILWYARKIKEDNLPCTFNLVTNGVNTKPYKELKECGIEKIFLSVDNVFSNNGVRKGSTFTKALTECNKCGIEVEVFIDLHNNNYHIVDDIISKLYNEYGVKSFFIRTIRSLGNASNQIILNGEELYSVFRQIDNITSHNKDIYVQYSLSSEYIPVVLSYEPLNEIFELMDSNYTLFYGENFFLFLERYCARYEDITLTPDGYVLGCASEVSRKDYDKISAGNVLENSLTNILKKGDELRCKCSSKFPCDGFSCIMNKI